MDVSLQMVGRIGHDEGGDLIALHVFDGLCDGDVFPDGLGIAGHEGVDPLIPKILPRADKTPDIAVGQDAEEGVIPVRDKDESLVLFIHLPDCLQHGRIASDAGDLRAADHDIPDLGPEPGTEISAGMEFVKVFFLEIPSLDQGDGEGISHRKSGGGTRSRGEAEGAGLLCYAHIDDHIAGFGQRGGEVSREGDARDTDVTDAVDNHVQLGGLAAVRDGEKYIVLS